MRPYGCWSEVPNPRGRDTETWVQDGWIDQPYCANTRTQTRIPKMVKIKTVWTPMACGKLRQQNYTDPKCAGCANDPEKT